MPEKKTTTPRATRPKVVTTNALKFKQGSGTIYSFALPGGMLTEVADISRIKRTDNKKLEGFQRPEIQRHVKEITEYLDKGPGLFPNAVILALSSKVAFSKKRGSKIEDLSVTGVEAGKLSIPILPEGEKGAWIVDGQQRSLALSRSQNSDLLVPVIAFESTSIETHREQFILVNRAKQLSQRWINELLPQTDDTLLPKDLAANRVPSSLCALLDARTTSPFHNRVARKSERATRPDVIVDSAVTTMIRDRINGTSGALLHLRSDGRKPPNLNEMYRLLTAYWSAIAKVFPEAWNLPPDKSRLTAAVGISVMGVMMDRISARVGYGHKDMHAVYVTELRKIAKHCAWTSGTWSEIGMPWDALESTSRSSGRVVQFLGALYVRLGAQ